VQKTELLLRLMLALAPWQPGRTNVQQKHEAPATTAKKNETPLYVSLPRLPAMALPLLVGRLQGSNLGSQLLNLSETCRELT
jgi:hypothetical protein